MPSRTLKKQWRSMVVKRALRSGAISCFSQIKNITDCGSLLLRCGKKIVGNNAFATFESMYRF